MGPLAPALGYIAAAASVVGTVMSYQQSRAAAASQEEAAEAAQQRQQVEQNMANIKVERQKREQIRKARAARGEVINLGATTGTSSSSGVQGGAGSVLSQTGGNLSYMNKQQGLSNKASIFAQRSTFYGNQAAQQSSNSKMWGNVASSAYNTFGGQQQFQSWGKDIQKKWGGS